MTARSTEQARRQTAFILSQSTDDRGHAANLVGNFGKKLHGGARSEVVQMLDPPLKAEPIEWVEMDHGA
jgi:hypothetical protein